MDEKPNEPEMKEVLRQLSDILLLNGNSFITREGVSMLGISDAA